MDMRYVGQEHSVNVLCPLAFTEAALGTLVERFHGVHEQTYTYRLPNDPVIMTNLRLDAVGRQPTARVDRLAGAGYSLADAQIGERSVPFERNPAAAAHAHLSA